MSETAPTKEQITAASESPAHYRVNKQLGKLVERAMKGDVHEKVVAKHKTKAMELAAEINPSFARTVPAEGQEVQEPFKDGDEANNALRKLIDGVNQGDIQLTPQIDLIEPELTEQARRIDASVVDIRGIDGLTLDDEMGKWSVAHRYAPHTGTESDRNPNRITTITLDQPSGERIGVQKVIDGQTMATWYTPIGGELAADSASANSAPEQQALAEGRFVDMSQTFVREFEQSQAQKFNPAA